MSETGTRAAKGQYREQQNFGANLASNQQSNSCLEPFSVVYGSSHYSVRGDCVADGEDIHPAPPRSPLYHKLYGARFRYLIYDTLFAVDHKFDVKPQMVETWSVSDDHLTSYTFTLRDGLLFHDGAPVKSADCIASIKRWSQRDGMGQKLAALTKEWVAVDDKTFRLVLQQPYEFVLATLGKVGASVPFIMPERVAKTPITETIKDYTGSGPFVFDQAAGTSGVKLVFRRFDRYLPRKEPADWASGGKLAKVDTVEWIEFRDAMTAVNALSKGEIDLIHELPHDLAPLLESESKVKVMVYNELGQLGFIRFNFLFPPFNDVNARRAVLLAVKQKEFLEGLVGNPKYYSECRSIYSCGSPYETTAGLPGIGLDQAKKALKASPYDGSPIVQFHATNSATIGPLSEVLTRVLKEVGFNVKVEGNGFSDLHAQAPVAVGTC